MFLLKGAKGLIINITGGNDITLYEVDEAANRIKQEVDEDANIIYGTTCDERLEGVVRVSLVATGIDVNSIISPKPLDQSSKLSIDNSVYHNKINDLVYNHDLNEHEVNLETSQNENDIENEYENKEIAGILDKKNISDNIDTDNLDENNLDDNISLEKSIIDDEILDNNNNLLSEEIHSDQGIEHIESNHIDSSKSDNILEEELISTSNQSVRRLSLFDTLENNNSEDLNISEQKTEPVFQEEQNMTDSQGEQNSQISSEKEEINVQEEFSAEETEIEDDFNQESDEELLDIPTFLRRQAN